MPQSTTETYLHLPRRLYFSALEWHAVAIGSIAAIVLIGGYGFNIEPLRYLVPGFPDMRLNTAAAFMALTVGYLLSLRPSQRARWGSITIALGLVGWLAYARLSWAASQAPGQAAMLPSDATIFYMLAGSLSLLLINVVPSLRVLIGALALTAAAPALYRILGLLLFGGAPEPASPMNAMALHTAILIAWFMLVCVMLHPALGFGRIVLQPSLRGRLLRCALPAVVIIPVVATAVSLAMRMMFGWSDEALFALNASLSVTIGAMLVWWLSELTSSWQAEANEHAARLTRANEALEQYASSAAHDLKAPARHVLLYGELLEEAISRGDMEAARRYMRSIRESAGEMPRMIDGLLDYSRSAFTRVTLADTPLSELVQAAAVQHAPELEAIGAKIALVNDAVLRCDPTLMTSVFQNLIANAAKNRKQGRPLVIRISCLREPEAWRIVVEDNGSGFEADFAAVAFNPLARGAPAAGEGAGIGLATCRTIVQSHGGEIRIDREYTNGARIEFTLPRKAESRSRHRA